MIDRSCVLHACAEGAGGAGGSCTQSSKTLTTILALRFEDLIDMFD